MIDPIDESAISDPAALLTVVRRLANLFETRIAPALERIAEALERSPAGSTPINAHAAAVAGIREAIRDGELALAETRLADLDIDFPDATEFAALAEELAEASHAMIDDRRKRMDAARAASDPEAVVAFRNELADLLDPQALEPLDKEVLAWLMSLLMRRMRTGTVRADVALLAARVAESFPHRPEGASLRASLPTIRRSAGLCARCAEPYLGVEDACPQCLAGVPRIADLPETPIVPT